MEAKVRSIDLERQTDPKIAPRVRPSSFFYTVAYAARGPVIKRRSRRGCRLQLQAEFLTSLRRVASIISVTWSIAWSAPWQITLLLSLPQRWRKVLAKMICGGAGGNRTRVSNPSSHAELRQYNRIAAVCFYYSTGLDLCS